MLSTLISILTVFSSPYWIMLLWGSIASDFGFRTISFGTSCAFVILAIIAFTFIKAGADHNAKD